MGAVIISAIMLLVTIYTPLSQYFYTVPLSIKDWLLIIIPTLVGLAIYEVSKLLGHSSVTTTERHYAPLMVTDIDNFVL